MNLPEFDRSAGLTKIGALVFVAFFGSVVWAGFHILPIFYYNQELIGYMESQAAKAQVFGDDEIRKNIIRTIRKLEIPIDDEDDLKINRLSGEIVIELKYYEPLFIEIGEWERHLHTFTFDTVVRHPLP